MPRSRAHLRVAAAGLLMIVLVACGESGEPLVVHLAGDGEASSLLGPDHVILVDDMEAARGLVGALWDQPDGTLALFAMLATPEVFGPHDDAVMDAEYVKPGRTRIRHAILESLPPEPHLMWGLAVVSCLGDESSVPLESTSRRTRVAGDGPTIGEAAHGWLVRALGEDHGGDVDQWRAVVQGWE